ncbi:glycosyltransferase family 4 protein [Dethiosulfatarculus sandiegensis]|nr:glycosyltransferase family 1 protein [Dethiosulfatarculus sandiegensis]
MEPSMILDGRPLQPGFKAHHERGIGRYARNLLRAMEDLYGPQNLELIVQENLPDPGPISRAKRLKTRCAPEWLPFGQRLCAYHWQVGRSLAPSWHKGKVVHFLSHLDAPARVGPKTVITVHDLIFQRLPHLYGHSSNSRFFKLKRWLESRCLFGAAHLISVSEQTKRDIQEIYGLPAEKITVIPEACDPGLQPVDDLCAQGEVLGRLGVKPPFFLYLGGIDQRKGLDTLFEALAHLKQKNEPHELVLVGNIEEDKSYQGLLNSLEQKGLQKSVHLPGFVSDQDLPCLFSACLAFVFPSCYEGFGLPPLEAMTMGAPVIASRASAVPEVVADAGILVEPNNPGELAQAMARLANDNELACKMREKGRKRACLFSWEEAARKTWQVYREVGLT